MSDRKYFGKYRGIVTDNKDPLMLGRVRARVPDAMGDKESGWATPCFPFAGSQTGMFCLPDIDAGVWIEFEHGDLDYPIWSGCYFLAMTDVPTETLVPPYQKVLLKTKGGHSIILDDTPGIGGITLSTAGGQKIKLTALGIEIDNGLGASVKMNQLTKVTINDGALEVLF